MGNGSKGGQPVAEANPLRSANPDMLRRLSRALLG